MPQHVHMLLSTEICGVAGRRVHRGQERNPPGLQTQSSTDPRFEVRVVWDSTLGMEVLRQHGRRPE
jgi:hypothetical protein